MVVHTSPNVGQMAGPLESAVPKQEKMVCMCAIEPKPEKKKRGKKVRVRDGATPKNLGHHVAGN